MPYLPLGFAETFTGPCKPRAKPLPATLADVLTSITIFQNVIKLSLNPDISTSLNLSKYLMLKVLIVN
jgi:hypothetical protein